jgi:hypothetical protein
MDVLCQAALEALANRNQSPCGGDSSQTTSRAASTAFNDSGIDACAANVSSSGGGHNFAQHNTTVTSSDDEDDEATPEMGFDEEADQQEAGNTENSGTALGPSTAQTPASGKHGAMAVTPRTRAINRAAARRHRQMDKARRLQRESDLLQANRRYHRLSLERSTLGEELRKLTVLVQTLYSPAGARANWLAQARFGSHHNSTLGVHHRTATPTAPNLPSATCLPLLPSSVPQHFMRFQLDEDAFQRPRGPAGTLLPAAFAPPPSFSVAYSGGRYATTTTFSLAGPASMMLMGGMLPSFSCAEPFAAGLSSLPPLSQLPGASAVPAPNVVQPSCTGMCGSGSTDGSWPTLCAGVTPTAGAVASFHQGRPGDSRAAAGSLSRHSILPMGSDPTPLKQHPWTSTPFAGMPAFAAVGPVAR